MEINVEIKVMELVWREGLAWVVSPFSGGIRVEGPHPVSLYAKSSLANKML